MITTLKEKKGGCRTLTQEDTQFNAFINERIMINLEALNGIYTWNNKRGGAKKNYSFLNRFFVSENILAYNGDLLASILPSIIFDHWPICLHWQGIHMHTHKSFRFEKLSLSYPDFIETIQNWWNSMNSTCM